MVRNIGIAMCVVVLVSSVGCATGYTNSGTPVVGVKIGEPDPASVAAAQEQGSMVGASIGGAIGGPAGAALGGTLGNATGWLLGALGLGGTAVATGALQRRKGEREGWDEAVKEMTDGPAANSTV